VHLSREGKRLRVPSFRIERPGQAYVAPTEIEIDLALVAPGRYRVIAVHNFHVEDRNPDLTESVAGIFLAGRRQDGSWEVPERFPVECRALETLATIEVASGGAVLVEP
jgi:hypothetical protein